MNLMDVQTMHRNDLPTVAHELIQYMPEQKIFAFSGPLGAGKTTLVQEMLKQLRVAGPIVSPTYTYVSVYQLSTGKTVYHFDLYRINTLDEFIVAGFDEYLYQSDSWCFIEWPEVINELLTDKVVAIKLEHEADDTRSLSVTLK